MDVVFLFLLLLLIFLLFLGDLPLQGFQLGQLVEHGGLQSLWFGACGATARGLLWRASIMEIAPLF